jgi:hypothetical protein
VANLCRVRGDTAGAYRLHIAALRLARRTGNARELWNQHNNLADVLLELGESHRALWYARRATAIARDRHLIVPEAIALTTLGKVALRLGWISLAKTAASRAREIALGCLDPAHQVVADAARIVVFASRTV